MKTFSIATLGIVVAAAIAACDMPTSTSCKENLQCVGTAGSDQGGSANGGSTTKGGTTSRGGSGGAATSSGGSSTDACNDKCTVDTPVCDLKSKSCVECTKNSHCTATETPVCDTRSNTCVGCLGSGDCTVDTTKAVCKTATTTCVGCLANTDCTSATASLCDTSTNACGKCSVDADCTHIAGKNVCSSGTCVQCTGAKYSACGQIEGKNLVCDSLTNTCSTTKTERSVAECQACISDVQCIAGQSCARQTYNATTVGYFCFWKQGDTANGAPTSCFANGRPYVKTEADVVSIDGTTATLCTLRTSTCTAMNQFSSTDCAPTGSPNDAMCGFASGVDSKCAETSSNSGIYRCTTACLSSDDCKSGLTCNTLTTPDTCTFQ